MPAALLSAKTEDGLEIDLYIIVSFGVRISEVVQEAQKKVKYVLEKTLSQDIAAVNVFVQGVRTVRLRGQYEK